VSSRSNLAWLGASRRMRVRPVRARMGRRAVPPAGRFELVEVNDDFHIIDNRVRGGCP
jgi:hypothetical protein